MKCVFLVLLTLALVALAVSLETGAKPRYTRNVGGGKRRSVKAGVGIGRSHYSMGSSNKKSGNAFQGSPKNSEGNADPSGTSWQSENSKGPAGTHSETAHSNGGISSHKEGSQPLGGIHDNAGVKVSDSKHGTSGSLNPKDEVPRTGGDMKKVNEKSVPSVQDSKPIHNDGQSKPSLPGGVTKKPNTNTGDQKATVGQGSIQSHVDNPSHDGHAKPIVLPGSGLHDQPLRKHKTTQSTERTTHSESSTKTTIAGKSSEGKKDAKNVEGSKNSPKNDKIDTEQKTTVHQ